MTGRDVGENFLRNQLFGRGLHVELSWRQIEGKKSPPVGVSGQSCGFIPVARLVVRARYCRRLDDDRDEVEPLVQPSGNLHAAAQGRSLNEMEQPGIEGTL